MGLWPDALRWGVGNTVRAVGSCVYCQEWALWGHFEEVPSYGRDKDDSVLTTGDETYPLYLLLAAAHGTSPLGVPVHSYTHLQFHCAVEGILYASMCLC